MKSGILILLCFCSVASSFAQSLTLISPNGLQRWQAGSQRNILFSSAGVSNVRIEYSSNSGMSWSDVVASTPAASGRYLWSVPTTLSNESLIRISGVENPALADTSDRLLAIVAPRPGSEFDFVFYSDSPTPNYYDPSWGFAVAPSTVERVGDNKFPVSPQYSLVGNYALRLSWTSRAGGDWGMAIAGEGWVPRNTERKDSLIFHVLSSSFMFPSELPLVYLEDSNNRKTAKIPLRQFVGAVGQEMWQRMSIPLQAFRDNPGQADLTQIKSIFFGQDGGDDSPHLWFIDDVRMVGLRQFSDTAKAILVIGSSTAAGTGASSPDSSWVGRYRTYVRSLDPAAQVVNLAVGGYTTYDVMPTGYVPPPNRPTPKPNNNISAALAYRPAAIVVNLPSNDVAFGYSVQEQLINYDTLWSRAAARSVPIWITTSQPRNISDPVVRDRLRVVKDSILARYGARAIDVWNGLAAPDGTILPQFNVGDGIHLNNAGHRLIYERVVAANIWQTVTAIARQWSIPEVVSLSQNYPNPFNPETTIRYSLPVSGRVRLKVFDVLGREVADLVNELQSAGEHEVRFNASRLASGVLYYRLTVGGVAETKRMVFIR